MRPAVQLLVAVDVCEASLNAVRYVGRLFAPERCAVTLYHVLPAYPEAFMDVGDRMNALYDAYPVSAWKAEQHERIQRFGKKAAAVLEKAGFAPASVTRSIEDRRAGIARDILEEARRNYDAVVIGRRGGGAAETAVMGSVAAKLADKIDYLPLIVVGSAAATDNVLIAFDGSRDAQRAVDTVGRLLAGHRGRFTICQVVRSLNLSPTAGERIFQPEDESRWQASVNATLSPALEAAQARLAAAGVDPQGISTEIVHGQLSRAGNLVSKARADGYGTIVLGRRGLTVTEAFVSGRVTRKVLDMGADLTVWVVN